MTKASILDKAVEIAKEHARSGGGRSVEVVLERVYKTLERLSKEE